MVRSLLLAPLAIVAASAAVLNERQSTCACGYKDNSGSLWRERMEADFTLGWNTILNNYFEVFDYGETHAGAPNEMKYTKENVYGYNDGLGLKTSAYSGSGPVKTAGIRTLRKDILYGSFRIRATVPTVPGVCFGFFTYKDNTYTNQESDIEFLSSDVNYHETVHHTNHPGLVNGNTDTEAYKKITVPGADFTAFNEHRLDWLPTLTIYHLNGELKSLVRKNSPTLPSSVIANVWSDGTPGWSQGPPTQDAIATVYYIKAYFNSTTLTESQFNSQCAASTNKSPCLI